LSDAVRIVDRIQDQADFDATNLRPGATPVWNGQHFAAEHPEPAAHGASHAVGGEDPVRPADLGEFFDQRRSSDVSTLPRVLAGTSLALASGYVYGALAIATAGGPFTGLRFMTGASVREVEHLRMGLWNSGGELLAESDDVAASVAEPLTVQTVQLSEATTLTAGEAYFLGAGASGASFSLRGTAAAAPAASPVLSRGSVDWDGGELPPITAIGFSGAIPWLELLR
jgi:hypothetical protein